MANEQVQLRKGTAAEHAAFTGAAGEVTYDSTNKALRVHDGATAGGFLLPRTVDAFKAMRGGIYGLTLANNATYAATHIDIAPGSARDSTNVYDLELTTGLTKRLDAAWAVGNGNGGLDSSAKAANATYHIHLIRRDSDGLRDALFSTSATNPLLPAGWSALRRIGAVLTDGSSNIRAFLQTGGWFYYKGTPSIDVNAAANGQSPVLRTLSVPKGIKVLADLICTQITSTPATDSAYIVTDPDLGAPDATTSAMGVGYRSQETATMHNPRVWTDTAGRVYTADQLAANATTTIRVRGWFDPRDEYL